MWYLVSNQLCFDALQGSFISHTNKHNVGNAFLGTQSCKVINSMIRLNDLMLDGDIGADKDVNVLLDLGHIASMK
jgi:hypothetical protein